MDPQTADPQTVDPQTVEVVERGQPGASYEGVQVQDTWTMDDLTGEIRIDPRLDRKGEPATELIDRDMLRALAEDDDDGDGPTSSAYATAQRPTAGSSAAGTDTPTEPRPLAADQAMETEGLLSDDAADRRPTFVDGLGAFHAPDQRAATEPTVELSAGLPSLQDAFRDDAFDMGAEYTVPSMQQTLLPPDSMGVDDEDDNDEHTAVSSGPPPMVGALGTLPTVKPHTPIPGTARSPEFTPPRSPRASHPPSSSEPRAKRAPTEEGAITASDLPSPEFDDDQSGLSPMVGIALVGSGGLIAALAVIAATALVLTFLLAQSFQGGSEPPDTLPPIELPPELPTAPIGAEPDPDNVEEEEDDEVDDGHGPVAPRPRRPRPAPAKPEPVPEPVPVAPPPPPRPVEVLDPEPEEPDDKKRRRKNK